MLRKFAFASSLAVLCAGVAVGAQQPTPDPKRPDATQQRPADQQPAAQASAERTTTVEGCVYQEKDIPGRTPNVAERAGVLEDYILVASSGSGSRPGATGTAGTTGTAGSTASAAGAAKMFKLEHKPDHQLSAMVGKRVQVTGKIDAERSDSTGAAATRPQDKSAGPDRVNLPEFEITSIREAQGECPAKAQVNP